MNRAQTITANALLILAAGVSLSACAAPETQTPTRVETALPSLFDKADRDCVTGQNLSDGEAMAYAKVEEGGSARIDNKNTLEVTREGEKKLNGRAIPATEGRPFVTQLSGSETLIVFPIEGDGAGVDLLLKCSY